MGFRLTLAWDDPEFVDRVRAKEELQEYWAEISDLSEGRATLVTMDVQQLPRQGGFDKGGPFPPSHTRAGEEEAVQEYAERVPHPWDQGASIFPDDHPLARYERIARDRGDQDAGDAFLELPSGQH